MQRETRMVRSAAQDEFDEDDLNSVNNILRSRKSAPPRRGTSSVHLKVLVAELARQTNTSCAGKRESLSKRLSMNGLCQLPPIHEVDSNVEEGQQHIEDVDF